VKPGVCHDKNNTFRVVVNMSLTRISGPKGHEVTERRTKLHSEELRDLCPSLNIIRVAKSRRMKQTENVATMGETKAFTKFGLESPKGKYHSEDHGVNGRLILIKMS
jgi:hypothetical protein